MNNKPLTKREEKKQRMYMECMEKNSRLFSEMTMQRLGLEKEDGTNYICKFFDEDDEDDNFLILNRSNCETINFDGFRYVSYDDIDKYKNSQEVKLFDPYNNIKLCTFLLQWYIVNIYKYNIDNIIVIGITNARMNDPGYAYIKGRDNYGRIWELKGGTYNRDCIKYLDLIYKLDGAFPLEFNKLKEVDMVQYDNFNG